MRPWRNRRLLQMEMEKTGTECAGHHSLAVAKLKPATSHHQGQAPPTQNMIKKKLIGFESDGGEEVGNGREEETRKKREKRGSKRELTGTWMGAGRRDLGTKVNV